MRTKNANTVNNAKLTKLKNIYHVSDIHIKKILHKDITHAFSEIVKTISDSRETSGTILVMAGDIFEHKTYISQHDSQCFRDILKMLIEAKITTIIIPGNHDFERHNSLDLITPLVMNEDGTPIFDNIYCYAKSGVYIHMGVEFHVISPVDKIIPPIEKNKNTKIAIVHETINGANTYQDKVASGFRLGQYNFAAYDYVLLGDIHKYQVFNENVAYSGSLVQKDRGEDLVHGYIKWDLEKKTHQFVQIPLYSAYIDIKVIDNTKIKDADLPNVIAKEINVNYERCTEDFNATLYSQIYSKYEKINIDKNKNKIPFILRFNNHNVQTMVDSKTNNKVVIGGEEILRENLNLNTLDNQLQIITAYLKDIGKHDIIDKIIEIHKSKAEHQVIYKRWKLNWLKWNNISCYNTDNFINFDNINGIASILGKNKTGKSSIITALLYCLTGDAGRLSTTVIDDIINKHVLNRFQNKKDIKQINAVIECGFSIDDIKYLVHVNIKESNENFIIQNGVQITYNRDQTYEVLASLVNTIDIFNMVTVKGQDFHSIADMKDTTLVKQFDAIIGSDALNAILYKVKKQLAKLDADIESDGLLLKKMFSGSEKNYEENSSEVMQLTSEISKLNINIKKFESQHIELIKSIPTIYNLMTDDDIEAEIKTNNGLLSKMENIKVIKSVNNVNKANKLTTQFTNLLEEVNVKYDNLISNPVKEPLYTEGIDVKLTKEEILEKIKNCQSNIPKLCDIVNKNLTITQIQLKIEKLEKNYMEYFDIKKISDINYVIKKISDEDMQYQDIEIQDEYTTDYIPNFKYYSQKFEEKKHIEQDYTNIKKNIEDLKEQIANATKKHDQLEYNPSCSSCAKNSHHFSTLYKIDELNNTLNTLKKNEEKYNGLYKKYLLLKYIFDTTPEQMKIYNIQQNIIHNDFMKKIIQLKSDYEQLQSEKYRNEQTKYEYMLNNLHYFENIDKYNNYISELNNLKNIRKQHKDNIEYYQTILKKYNLSCSIQSAKKAIVDKKKIVDILGLIELLKSELYEKQQRRAVLQENMNLYINSLEEKQKITKKLNQNIGEQKILSEYVTMLHSNNLPYKVMKHSMDRVLIVVNNILNEVCDFTVGLECTETPTKNDTSIIRKKLRIIINESSGYSTLPINSSMGSGFQKFIIDIAFRIAFIKCIPSLPKFLIIDEGFGSLDDNNRYLAKNALSKIASDKKYIDFILIISHQNEFNNISQTNIEIKQIQDKVKNSGRFYSQVQYGTKITPMKCVDKIEYTPPNNNDEQLDEDLILFENKHIVYDVEKALFMCKICRPDKQDDPSKPYVCTKKNVLDTRNKHIDSNKHKLSLKNKYEESLKK